MSTKEAASNYRDFLQELGLQGITVKTHKDELGFISSTVCVDYEFYQITTMPKAQGHRTITTKNGKTICETVDWIDSPTQFAHKMEVVAFLLEL